MELEKKVLYEAETHFIKYEENEEALIHLIRCLSPYDEGSDSGIEFLLMLNNKPLSLVRIYRKDGEKGFWFEVVIGTLGGKQVSFRDTSRSVRLLIKRLIAITNMSLEKGPFY